MGKDKETATVVLDDDLVKEIIDGAEGSADEEGRIVRIDPATREKGGAPADNEDTE